MKKIIMLILLFSLMVIIFSLSNEPSNTSKKTSDKVTDTIITVLEKIKNHKFSSLERKKLIKDLTRPVRKGAHFTLYFVLSIICYNLLRSYNISIRKTLILSLLICILYSCSDELHQLFVKGRTSEIGDVFIDTFGSLVGLSLCSYLHKIRNKKVIT